MKKSILALSLAFTCLTANAEIIVGDWKAQGDGLLRLDTETGKEWIDTMQTWERSINSLQSEFGEGGQFEGFRVAGRFDVEKMVASVFNVSSLSLIMEELESQSGGEPIGGYRYMSKGRSTLTIGSDAHNQALYFESLFQTGLTEKSYSERDEEIFSYDRYLYLSDGADVYLNGDIYDDVFTLNSYVKINDLSKASTDDQAFFDVNDVNGNLNSGYASIFLVADDLNSYSYNNDSDYRAAKEAGEIKFANDVPVQGLFALPILGLLSLTRRKKS